MGASSVDSIEILQASPPSMRGESSAISKNVYGIVGAQLMTNAIGKEVRGPEGHATTRRRANGQPAVLPLMSVESASWMPADLRAWEAFDAVARRPICRGIPRGYA